MIEPRNNPDLNSQDKQFHQYVYDVLTNPMLNFRTAERTVVPTIGSFGSQITYDLTDGSIPLSMTKPIAIKNQLLPEIAGFLRGETNLKWYRDRGVTIWNKNTFNFYRTNHLPKEHKWSLKNLQKDTPAFNEALQEYDELLQTSDDPRVGDTGNFYPVQWRQFKGLKNAAQAPSGYEIIEVDQIQNLIEELIERPTNRYAIVTAWNPIDVKLNQAALAPCHNMFMAYRHVDLEGVDRVSVKLFQRSADIYAGVNFNNMEYATITNTLAEIVGSKPGFFIHSFGDEHAYAGHKDSERVGWYQNNNNLLWLQNELKNPDSSAEASLEKLLHVLPTENEHIGYDHVPYLVKQLSRISKGPAPKLEVLNTDINTLDVDDFRITGYDFNRDPAKSQRPEKILINGYKDQMAS